MPYIPQERREEYDVAINTILSRLPDDQTKAAGEFTYVIYRLLDTFNGKYWERALGVGSLIMAILEIYRKNHGLYEDTKIKQHGDVNPTVW